MARVQSWLKCSSLPPGKGHTHSPQDHTHSSHDHTTLHVHFAEEEEICACADDASSTGSSHTSGIVTDFPSSPKLHPSSPKLLPSCSCPQCSDFSSSFSTTTTTTHCHANHEDLSKNSEKETSDDTVDTVIDMPLDTQQPHPPHTTTLKESQHVSKLLSCAANGDMAQLRSDVRNASSIQARKSQHLSGTSRGKMIMRSNGRKFVVAPEPPTNVCISHGGKRSCFIVSWNPVR